MAALLDAAYERLDIPPPGTHEMQAWRLSNPFISTAQAATEPDQPTQRLAAAHALVAVSRPVPDPAASRRGGASWGIQVGAYASSAAARGAAANARRVAGDGDVRIESVVVRGKVSWRAQLVGMTEQEMRAAVGNLERHHLPAQPLRPEGERLASG